MRNAKHQVVAELGRAQGMLEAIEALPECKSCTTINRKVLKIIRVAKRDIAATEKSSMFTNIVVRVSYPVMEYYYALLCWIDWLKDYFNFYIQHALKFEHSC